MSGMFDDLIPQQAQQSAQAPQGSGSIFADLVPSAAPAQPRSAMQSLDDAARWAANFATLGYADKAAAYLGSLTGGPSYEQGLQQERVRSRQAEENVPLAAKIPLGIAGAAPLILGGGPAGILASGARLAGAPRVAGLLGQVAAPATTAGRIGAGVAEGAALGALEATGRDTDVASGAALGGAAGGAGAALISPLLSRLTTQRTTTTPEGLREAANQAYETARSADVLIKPQSFRQFADDATKVAQDFSMDPVLQPAAMQAFKRINSLSNRPVSLDELDNLRKILGDVKASTVPSERELARRLTDKLDNYVSSIDPAKNVMIGRAEARQGIDAFNEARKLWSRQAKGGEIDELIRRAELSAPNYSASGMENALRTEFRNLAKNQARMRTFTKEEQQAIEAVAKGGAVTNAMRMLGKLAPRGIVSGGVLTGITAANPALGAAAFLAGEIGKRGATARTTRAAESARNLMLSGQPITNRPMTAAEQALYQASVTQPAMYSGGLLGQ